MNFSIWTNPDQTKPIWGTGISLNTWITISRVRLGYIDKRTLLAFTMPFALYILTLAPTVYNLDSAELTTAVATGGLVRATGYPLYLLLGYLWSWLPLGDMGYRLNLFSAFNGALTIALAERILRRWQVGGWATFGALGLLACAPYFWALSLIAEVYTLHTALMAVIILLLLHWAERPSPTRIALVGLAIGLSLGHHAATVLLIPGCVWYVLTVAPRRTLAFRSVFFGATATIIGLSIYLYLPFRYSALPAFNYAGRYDYTGTFIPVNLHTPHGLWWLISGQVFAGEMLAYSGLKLWQEVQRYGVQLWQAFFAIGLGPGLLGLGIQARRDWRLAGMLLLMFGFSAGFYIDYRVADKDTMFLPTYLIWALWVGVGYQWLLKWATLNHHKRRSLSGPEPWLLRGVMSLAVVGALGWNWALVDLSNDWSARTRAETILQQVQPNALILGWWDMIPMIEYLQLVEGQRPDVQAINRFLIDYDTMTHLIQRSVTDRPVYINRLPLELNGQLQARSLGPIDHVTPREKTYPSEQVLNVRQVLRPRPF